MSASRPIDITIQYQNKTLTKVGEKDGGKNTDSEFNGTFKVKDEKDVDGDRFFVKKPDDKKELFTELLAGRYLTKLKEKGLVPEEHRDSLICADVVKLNDGSYALIQPFKNITDLNKYFREGSAAVHRPRSPILEMLLGQSYLYTKLNNLGSLDTLSACLFYSLMIGDYSVHSENVVYWEKEQKEANSEITVSDFLSDSFVEIEKPPIQYGRIDWGAAWRNFGHEDNRNVMSPLEYQEYQGVKAVTKGYLALYKNVEGLYALVTERAKNFLSQKDLDITLIQVMREVVNGMPRDLLTEGDKIETAKYIGIDFLKDALNGELENIIFADAMTSVIRLRIQQLARLSPSSTLTEQQPVSIPAPHPISPVAIATYHQENKAAELPKDDRMEMKEEIEKMEQQFNAEKRQLGLDNQELRKQNEDLLQKAQEQKEIDKKINEDLLQKSREQKEINERILKNNNEIGGIFKATTEKTPWWKYVALGVLITVGLAAIGSGVGALVLLGVGAAIVGGCLIGAGVVALVGGGVAAHKAVKYDQHAKQEQDKKIEEILKRNPVAPPVSVVPACVSPSSVNKNTAPPMQVSTAGFFSLNNELKRDDSLTTAPESGNTSRQP